LKVGAVAGAKTNYFWLRNAGSYPGCGSLRHSRWGGPAAAVNAQLVTSGILLGQDVPHASPLFPPSTESCRLFSAPSATSYPFPTSCPCGWLYSSAWSSILPSSSHLSANTQPASIAVDAPSGLFPCCRRCLLLLISTVFPSHLPSTGSGFFTFCG
jgi:hypothetical protein